MSDERVRYTLEKETALLQLDDGKANSLSPAMQAEIGARLDLAEREAKAVVLAGREGRFSAGFDLKTMAAGPEAAFGMVLGGAELMLRLVELPIPVVAACSGHALAAGALLLLSSDLRIGSRGDFKIGLNEVAIGMTVPLFALELAGERLSKRHLRRATQMAEIYGPEGAEDAGYLDRLEEPARVTAVALEQAARLAELPQPAFGNTKQRNAAALAARIRANLQDDIARMTGFSKD
jgi:enoyl-CoA hydratase